MTSEPHPELVPLLQKYELSWELFSKRGRPSRGVKEKRIAIVTELHAKGTPWKDMVEITGMSHGFVQRNTRAVWNPNSRENARASGRATGAWWKGRKRPGQLERQWAKGDFDSLPGRVRSEEERERLREGWTEKARKERSRSSKERWSNSKYRQKLLKYHRSPEERARRSREQARRIEENPSKWSRGKAGYVTVSKEEKRADRLWVRSSYEAAAVELLEEDDRVLSYRYEPTLVLEGGRHIKPDFLVTYSNQGQELIEVKASWALSLPKEHKVQKRLKVARDEASARGWKFSVWTEQDRLTDVLGRKSREDKACLPKG